MWVATDVNLLSVCKWSYIQANDNTLTYNLLRYRNEIRNTRKLSVMVDVFFTLVQRPHTIQQMQQQHPPPPLTPQPPQPMTPLPPPLTPQHPHGPMTPGSAGHMMAGQGHSQSVQIPHSHPHMPPSPMTPGPHCVMSPAPAPLTPHPPHTPMTPHSHMPPTPQGMGQQAHGVSICMLSSSPFQYAKWQITVYALLCHFIL